MSILKVQFIPQQSGVGGCQGDAHLTHRSVYLLLELMEIQCSFLSVEEIRILTAAFPSLELCHSESVVMGLQLTAGGLGGCQWCQSSVGNTPATPFTSTLPGSDGQPMGLSWVTWPSSSISTAIFTSVKMEPCGRSKGGQTVGTFSELCISKGSQDSILTKNLPLRLNNFHFLLTVP